MLSLPDLVAMLLGLSAVFAWVNHRYVGLPHTIGLLVMGLLASIVLILFELAVPEEELYEALTAAIRQIDFNATLMEGMLAFLLFAGALHVDLDELRGRAWPVALMASFGVVISTVVIGVGVWLASAPLGWPVPLVWALVFGALISPTDPVAVLATLKVVKVPAALETEMKGESLFNDGVGVVVFSVLVAIAVGSGHEAEGTTPAGIARVFVVEAGGGALLGAVAGWIAYRMMREVDDFTIETLVTLALVTCTYGIAHRLHVSGPIAVVVAGLLVGHRGPKDAMSDQTQQHLFGFWTLLDEILNSVLFLLIGLEVLVVNFGAQFMTVAMVAIPLALVGRFAAVALPVQALRARLTFKPGTIPLLTWGGLRGGISVALALSLPDSEVKPLLLAATYAVVVFTIVVQGSTLAMVARRVVRA
jgi:CPA1 family monovalent cation:H+ antiporter